jgi:protein-L-isoaspartate(D-aspartate) O-methyltransferase
MIDRDLRGRGIKSEKVLGAMDSVPRHMFVPGNLRAHAYDDRPLPIGEGQTISQPYIVALMSELLELKSTDRVLEVGTGSGYQAAILSRLVKEVYSVEIHKPLGERASKVLKDLEYTNVFTRVGDGYAGWPEAAPFDAIIVTCAPEKIPPPLVEQLKDGGRLLIPLGDRYNQAVFLFTKKDGKLDAGKKLKPTLFVPMTGRAQREAAAERAKNKNN